MNPKKAFFLCQSSGARYETREAAEQDRLRTERKKGMNPDVLQAFRCEYCGLWHVGTRISHRIGSAPPRVKARRSKPRRFEFGNA